MKSNKYEETKQCQRVFFQQQRVFIIMYFKINC